MTAFLEIKDDLTITHIIKWFLTNTCKSSNNIPKDILQTILIFARNIHKLVILTKGNLTTSSSLNKIKYIFPQQNNIYLLDNNNNLYTQNITYQNQYGDKSINTNINKSSEFNNNKIHLISIGNTNYQTFFITKSNKIFQYSNSISQLINTSFRLQLKSIKVGLSHSLFLTKNNKVYGIGSNKYYQLSLPHNKEYQFITLISSLNTYNITKIIALPRASLF